MAKAKKSSSSTKTDKTTVSKPPVLNPLTDKPEPVMKHPFPTTKPKAEKKRTVFDAPDPIKPDTRAPVQPPAAPLTRQEQIEKTHPLGSTNRFATPPVPKRDEKPKAVTYPDFVNGGRTKLTPAEQAQIIHDTQSGKISKMQRGHFNSALQRGEIVPASIALTHLNIPLGLSLTKALGTHLASMPDDVARSTALKSLNIHNYNIFPNDPEGRKKYIGFLNEHNHSNLPANASDAEIIDAVGRTREKPAEGWNKLNPLRHGLNPATVINTFGEEYIHPLYNDLVVGPAHIGAGAAKGLLAVAQTGTMASGLNPSKPVPEEDIPIVKWGKDVAAGEEQAGRGFGDMVQHPLKALQNDPFGTALMGATLGESSIAKAASFAGKAGDAARLGGSVGPLKWNPHVNKFTDLLSSTRDTFHYTPREVKLTQQGGADLEAMNPEARLKAEAAHEVAGPPLPAKVQVRIDQAHARRVQEIEHEHIAQVKKWQISKKKGGFSKEEIADAEREFQQKHDEDIHIEDLKRDKAIKAAQKNVDPAYQPPVPVLTKGFKSPKPITRLVQNRIDRRAEGGSSAIFKGRDDRHPFSSQPSTRQEIAMANEVDTSKGRVVNATKAETDRLLRAFSEASHGLTTHEQIALIETRGQGVTHAQMRDYRTEQMRKNQARLDENEPTLVTKMITDIDTKIKSLHNEHPKPSPEVAQKIADLHTERAAIQAKRLTKKQRRELEVEQQNLQSHLDFHTGKESADIVPGSKEDKFLRAAADIARHGDEKLLESGRLDPKGARYRNFEPAIQIAREIKDHPANEIAQKIVRYRENLKKFGVDLRNLKRERGELWTKRRTEKAAARIEEIDAELVALEKKRGNVEHFLGTELDRFRNQHLGIDKNAVVDSMRAQAEATGDESLGRQANRTARGQHEISAPEGVLEPFRVPRATPEVPNRHAQQVQSGDLAGTPFGKKGRLKRTSSVQFTEGDYVPHINPLIQDALRLQKDIGGEKFLDSVSHIPEGQSSNHIGVTRAANGSRVGDIVAEPENFVLRSEKNIRRKLDTHGSDVSANLDRVNKAAEENTRSRELQDAWDEAMVEKDVNAETIVPATGGPYVLLPKAVEEAMSTELRHKSPPEWVNRWFRALTLYTRPGYAGRNIVQNIPLGMLEANPLALGKGLVKAFDKDRPMVPGVDQHGLFGSHTTEPTPLSASPAHIGQFGRDLLDFHWRDLSAKGTGKALAKSLTLHYGQVLTDSVKAISNTGENWTRRGLAHAKMSQEAKVLTRRMESTYPDVKTALEGIAKGDTPAAQAAADRVLKALGDTMGDYSKMPKAERLSALVPFWRWYYHIGKVMLKLPFEHPFTNQIIQGVGNVGAQWQQDLGQDYHSRSITDIPIAGDLRDATTWNSEAPNPFTSPADVVNNLASLSPLTSLVGDTARGQDVYGNPLTNQYGLPLSGKEKLQSILGQTLNLAAPVRLADSLRNPGRHSAESIPLFSTHAKVGSDKDYHRSHNPEFTQPDIAPWEAVANYLFGTGFNEKNITGDAKTNEQDAKKTHRTNLTKSANAKRKVNARRRHG